MNSANLNSQLLAFFGEEKGRTASGYTLEEILNWPNEEWESRHDFIQWVFPTDQASMFNPESPVLDSATVTALKADAVAMKNFARVYERWLRFCGIARVADGLAVQNLNPDVWHSQNHNWLRITRVLRSMNLLELHTEAEQFFRLLEMIKARVDARTWQFWRRAAGQPK